MCNTRSNAMPFVVTMMLAMLAATSHTTAFTPSFVVPRHLHSNEQQRQQQEPSFYTSGSSRNTATRLFSSTDTSSSSLPDLSTMKARDMKAELKSYGISTKSMLEKSEFEKALKQAREEGKTVIKPPPESSSSSAPKDTAETKTEKTADTAASRKERYDEAFAKGRAMKVGELKKELESRGVSTKSFFEKTEFVKAYAEAIADNVTGKGGRAREEPQDPSYRDVNMMKFDGRRLGGQAIIDVPLGK